MQWQPSIPRWRRSCALAGAAALAPWAWFLVRDWLAILDWVAIFLPVLVALASLAFALAALMTRRVALLGTAVSWAVLGFAAVLGPWLPQGGTTPEHGLRVVSANVLRDNLDALAASADLLARDGDVLVAVEVTPAIHRLLASSYPYVYDPPPGTAIGVYSRLPFTIRGPPAGLAAEFGVRIELAGPSGPFVLYALHLPRPALRSGVGSRAVSVSEHRRLIEDISLSIEAERLPVVVAGDLNLTDRSSGYRRLTGVLNDAMRAGWGGRTFIAASSWPFFLRIDHLFIPRDWCAHQSERVDVTGSDHRGVTAVAGPCPDNASPGHSPSRSELPEDARTESPGD